MKARAGLTAVAVALFVVVFAPSASADPLGSLKQLPGTSGCITSNDMLGDGCASSPALSDPLPIAQSPDGHSFYIGGNSFGSDAAFGGFSRNSDGSLSPIAGNCFIEEDTAAAGCTEQRGLGNLTDIEVSPDGKFVYVLGLGAFAGGDTTITSYSRDEQSGALSPVAGADGCIASATLTGCNVVDTIEDGARLAFGPDNEHLYVATNGSPGAIITLNRDPADGTLSAMAGDAGCVHTGAATAGCRTGHHLDGVNNLVVNGIGTRLYAAGGTSDGTVVSLAVGADGSLTQDTDPGKCFTGGTATADCSHGRGLAASAFGNPYGLALSQDNNDSLYVSGDGFSETTLSVFGTLVGGGLVQPAGEEGCFDIDTPASDEGCAFGRGLEGVLDIATSPDGENLYTAAYRGLDLQGGVGVYDTGFDGTSLVQQAGAFGCLTEGSGDDCEEGLRGASGPAGIAVSRDGESVYVTALDSSSIAAFTRQMAPTCSDSTAVVTAGTPASIPASCRDANGEPLTYTVVTQPEHGTAGGGGSLAYTSAAGYTGPDALTFKASDGEHDSQTATVTIDVRRAPDPVKPQPNALVIASGGSLKPDKKGRVSISLTCQGTAPAPCSGALRLSTRLKGKKGPSVAGQAPYSVPAGQTVAVVMRLSGKVRKALALKSLKATAGSFPATPGEAAVTAPLKLKKVKKKKA